MLLALLYVLPAAVATPPATAPVAAEEAAPSGPTDIMLLYGDVKSKVQVAGKTIGVPASLALPMGTYEVRITTSSGQLVVKTIEVGPPGESAQVIDLGAAKAASVPGHTFRFVAPAGVEGLVVFVDGVEGGPPPLEVLLSPGAHVVELQQPDGTRTGGERTLTPQGEGPTVVKLTP